MKTCLIFFAVVVLAASGLDVDHSWDRCKITTKPVVKTDSGHVQGAQNVTVGAGKTYYSYRGIPYAEPPVGRLRFEPPIAKARWSGTLDATDDKPFCTQGSNPVIGQEDCLYISVYTPTLSSNAKLPVMVWIHGGAFIGGRMTYEENGPDYFLDQDVILVALSYRLGIFGFLSTGDSVVPGNNGLKDQVLALKWVNQNIAAFGGDPNRITVFGGSAGSASTSYLMQTPVTKGLFQGAIMQSGVSLCLWTLSRKVKEAAFEVGTKLGKRTTDSQNLVDYLRNVNASSLQATATSVQNWKLLFTNPRNGLIYAPVIEPENDNAFITQKSHELLSQGNFHNIPCIIGFNSLEANFALTNWTRTFVHMAYDRKHSALVPIDINVSDRSKNYQMGEIIKSHYFGTKEISSTDFELKRFISDDQFVRPIREFARLVSKLSNVYFYRFAYEGGLSGYNRTDVPGVAHSEEVAYMFRSKYPPTSDNDILTRQRVITLWTNFAKYGNPTPKSHSVLQNLMWPQSNSAGDDNFVYLNINTTLTVGLNPEDSDMRFWDSFYQEYAIPPQDTY